MAVFFTLRKYTKAVGFYEEKDENIAISMLVSMNIPYKGKYKGKTLSGLPYKCVRQRTNDRGMVVGFSMYDQGAQAWTDEINVLLLKEPGIMRRAAM